jgi:hypothetical protein
MAQGLVVEMAQGLVMGMAQGLVMGMAQGLGMGMAQGLVAHIWSNNIRNTSGVVFSPPHSHTDHKPCHNCHH